ncbi:ATP-dependent RNA helicase drs1 [Frankliniella fusca]|uniref:ATP-dependent RNA helicase drs1 n=1 Tax=Frankliniella fusca TaxID=407009 RepID=A0AAE1HYY9_9NEOP|nr:ATP-dependent RNA helicase drs1 [Frankliniella fusca]
MSLVVICSLFWYFQYVRHHLKNFQVSGNCMPLEMDQSNDAVQVSFGDLNVGEMYDIKSAKHEVRIFDGKSVGYIKECVGGITEGSGGNKQTIDEEAISV